LEVVDKLHRVHTRSGYGVLIKIEMIFTLWRLINIHKHGWTNRGRILCVFSGPLSAPCHNEIFNIVVADRAPQHPTCQGIMQDFDRPKSFHHLYQFQSNVINCTCMKVSEAFKFRLLGLSAAK